jgi:hypothetical protein
MTTSSATIELSTRSAVRDDKRHGFADTIRRMQLAGRWLGQSGGAVTRWMRAGQLGADGSMDLARWSGARR